MRAGFPAFLRALLAGTGLGFLVSVLSPLRKPAHDVVAPYLRLLPPHARTQALLALVLLLIMGLLAKLPEKIVRSLRHGLIPLIHWTWALCSALLWVSYDWHYLLLAKATFLFTVLVSVIALIRRTSPEITSKRRRLIESDLPISECCDRR